MNAVHVILYVEDQARASRFYAHVLGLSPTLEVEGMTEFDLGGATLGLMPAADIVRLVPGVEPGPGQRCELYLRRRDAGEVLRRIPAAGGHLLQAMAPRPWGEVVGYALDPDGHVIAVAAVGTNDAGPPERQ